MTTVTQIRFCFLLPDAKTIKPAVNFWREAGPAETAERGEMAQAAYAGVAGSDLMDNFDDSISFLRAEAQNFTIEGPSEAYPNGRLVAASSTVASVGAALPGTSASGPPTPPQCAYVVSFQTVLPGPANRGRWYGPPPCDADVADSGRISAENCTSVQTSLDEALTNVAESTTPEHNSVVASRKHDDVNVIVGSVCHAVTRTQRRRALKI